MEIHAPDRHITSWRDVAVHLAIVTAGILIALGLEQTIEIYHHRHLVAEANELIVDEIRDNQKALEQQAAKLWDYREAAIEVLDFITALLQKVPGPKTTHAEWNKAPLHDTSWTTAQRTGALSYMTYREVNLYAAVYSLQADYLTAQDGAESAAVDAYSVFIRKSKGQPAEFQKLSPSELEAERAKVMHLISTLDLMIELKVEPLRSGYAEVVKTHSRD